MILKVGGSVVDKLDLLVDALRFCDWALIIPGGWVFADKVRELDRKFRLSTSTSHWMAITCMNLYGYFISEFGFDLVEPEDFDEIELKGVKVLLPYKLLRRYDELPHSWEVTSDSIAVWIASKLKQRIVVKVTDVEGLYINGKLVKEIDASNISGETCIDKYAPKLLKAYGIDMFICRIDRIKDYILSGSCRGTLIKGR